MTKSTIAAIGRDLKSFRSAEEIRAACVAEGVKGIRDDCNECVLARLLQLRHGILSSEDLHVVDYVKVVDEYNNDVEISLPQPCIDAIDKFDAGEWPELIEEEYDRKE